MTGGKSSSACSSRETGAVRPLPSSVARLGTAARRTASFREGHAGCALCASHPYPSDSAHPSGVRLPRGCSPSLHACPARPPFAQAGARRCTILPSKQERDPHHPRDVVDDVGESRSAAARTSRRTRWRSEPTSTSTRRPRMPRPGSEASAARRASWRRSAMRMSSRTHHGLALREKKEPAAWPGAARTPHRARRGKDPLSVLARKDPLSVSARHLVTGERGVIGSRIEALRA